MTDQELSELANAIVRKEARTRELRGQVSDLVAELRDMKAARDAEFRARMASGQTAYSLAKLTGMTEPGVKHIGGKR
jgi:predicted  nucleic acid-binding Zn-ribbon protein